MTVGGVWTGRQVQTATGGRGYPARAAGAAVGSLGNWFALKLLITITTGANPTNITQLLSLHLLSALKTLSNHNVTASNSFCQNLSNRLFLRRLILIDLIIHTKDSEPYQVSKGDTAHYTWQDCVGLWLVHSTERERATAHSPSLLSQADPT